MTHEAICGRGSVWMQRTKRCEPVLYGLSTGPEIPDVIGWQSDVAGRGSIVLEAKVSRSDFLRDKRKKHEQRMGDFRYIICPAGLLSRGDVEMHAPGHGLLWVDDAGLRVTVVLEAPARTEVNHRAEVQYLRKALIHVSYNLTAHGMTVHLPTLTKWAGTGGLRKPGDA